MVLISFPTTLLPSERVGRLFQIFKSQIIQLIQQSFVKEFQDEWDNELKDIFFQFKEETPEKYPLFKESFISSSKRMNSYTLLMILTISRVWKIIKKYCFEEYKQRLKINEIFELLEIWRRWSQEEIDKNYSFHAIYVFCSFLQKIGSQREVNLIIDENFFYLYGEFDHKFELIEEEEVLEKIEMNLTSSLPQEQNVSSNEARFYVKIKESEDQGIIEDVVHQISESFLDINSYLKDWIGISSSRKEESTLTFIGKVPFGYHLLKEGETFEKMLEYELNRLKEMGKQ